MRRPVYCIDPRSKFSCIKYSDSISDQLRFSDFSQLWGDQKRDETRNETDEQARMDADVQQQSNDYAIVETILETSQLDLSYYWDEPGTCFYRLPLVLIPITSLVWVAIRCRTVWSPKGKFARSGVA